MTADKGALAIVLHSHMPYVEGFDTWPFGEEWLWEATATSYLRLLPVLKDRPVTLAVTPVLADQFEAMLGEAGERFRAFLRETRTQVFAEEREAFERDCLPALVAEVDRAEADYQRAADNFDRLDGDLIAAIADLGSVELWGGPATHAILPLLATREGLRLQLRSGHDSHRRRFASSSRGIWLPECAWHPRLAGDLADASVARFCIDQTARWGLGTKEHLTPVAIEGGLTALAIDWQTVRLVWSSEGYPGRPKYRDTFKRTRLDLALWRNDGEVFDEEDARQQARSDAREFVEAVQARLATHLSETGGGGLCTFAIDAELLGHWWYEGPWWLEAVFDEAQRVGLRLVTAEQGLADFPSQTAECRASTWGRDKNFSTWDSPAVTDTIWMARKAEIDLVLSARRGVANAAAFERATREVLALQSSDWAFLQTEQTAGDYPDKRFAAHLANFREALALMAQSANPAEPTGQSIAPELASLAPDLDIGALAPGDL